MFRRATLFLVVLGLSGLPFQARGAVDQSAVDASIKRATDLLWSTQKDDGSWDWGDDEPRKLGITSLITLALFENGASTTELRFRKALGYIRANSPRNKDAYSVSLATVVLARVGAREDRALVRSLAVKIADGQHLTGGWHYTIPETPDSKAPRGMNMGDLSVSQFAVLALWQAQRIGAPVRGSFERIRQRLAWAQTPTGGWGYHGVPDMAESASMTTAGAFMWVVSSAYELKEGRRSGTEVIAPREPKRRTPFEPQKLLEEIKEDGAKTDEEIDKKLKEKESDRPVDLYEAVERGAFEKKRAANKAAKGELPHKETSEPGQLFHKAPDKLPPPLETTKPNPLIEDKPLEEALKRVAHYAEQSLRGGGTNYYYLWSIERLGVLLGMENFGKADWFELGAQNLLKKQNEDGSWGTKLEDEKEPARHQYLADTAFAVLFLKKANLGSDVTRLLNPDPEHAFAIEGAEKRYATLQEALTAAAADATIIINGDGPFPLAALTIDKNVTIRSAQGYEPVFRYQLPKDNFGFDVEVTKDSPARNMFIIAADKVTLEGLGIQMDPPKRKQDVLWTAIRCEGKPVRLLNCTLSESNRVGVTALRLIDSSPVFIRNSMFIGFEPTIAVETPKRCNLMIRDSLVYGPEVVRASGEGDFNFWFLQSTAFTDKFANLAQLKGATHAIAENNVIRANELVADLGPAGAERSWAGRMNLYDLRVWVNKGKSEATSVNDLDKWRKLWNTEEQRSKFAKAPFDVPRLQLGPYRADLSPQEWGVQEEVIRPMLSIGVNEEESVGANTFFVGSGAGYLQFREKFDYENWLSVTLPSEKSNPTPN